MILRKSVSRIIKIAFSGKEHERPEGEYSISGDVALHSVAAGSLSRHVRILGVMFCMGMSIVWAGVTEDFHGIAGGTPAGKDGWVYLFGPGSIADWIIDTPERPEGNGAPSLIGKTTGPNNQIYKFFNADSGITDEVGSFYFTVRFAPLSSGNAVQNIRFGFCTDALSTVVLFGILDGRPGASDFAFVVGGVESTESFPTSCWYEARLTINQARGYDSATGSLSVKNITNGDADFRPVAGLLEIPLKFERNTRPSQWAGWLVRSQYMQQIGSLSIEASKELP